MPSNTAEKTATLNIHYEERTFPPYDPFHGTNQPMRWRKVTIEIGNAVAAFEQTDYGHAGRNNPWDPRGISASLAPKTPRLLALADAAAAALG